MMRKKLAAVVAALVLALGLSAGVAPAPAQADSVTTHVSATGAERLDVTGHRMGGYDLAQAAALWHNCPSDTICLYQWTGYGAPAGAANPGWKSSFHNLLSQHCINLTQPAAYWPNGTPVWDNSAALIVGGSGAYGQGDSVSFYNSLNCSSATGVTSLNANWVTGYSDLHTVPIGGGLNAYHTIASLGWNGDQCPPGGC